MISKTDRQGLDVDAMETDSKSRTTLDSHATMVVVDKNCYVIAITGETMDVCPFTLEYEFLKKESLVDAALMYTCESNNKECLIIVRNEFEAHLNDECADLRVFQSKAQQNESLFRCTVTLLHNSGS